jgi:hypothetical protein
MSAATLAGHRATSARAYLPKSRCWYAEAQLDGEHTLTGRVDLTIADLTLSGTVLSGGPARGRSSYRVGAGAGRWGTTIRKWSYSDDAGSKVSKVVGDAAREAGETFDATSAPSAARVGPNFTRPEGPASRVLDIVAPGAWYVDETGTTRLGERAAGALVGSVTRITPVDLARGKLVLAAESIATILPGLVVDGLTAVDVLHEVTPESGLRSTVWGPHVGSTLDSLRVLLEQLDPDRAYRGVTEYRVDSRNGNRLNLQPVRASTGMPDLKNVPVRPGVAGCDAQVALASRVLVGFVDSDPSRPYVAAFEDADGDGFVPTTLTLSEGIFGAARMNDTVQAGPFGGVITSGSTKVKIG